MGAVFSKSCKVRKFQEKCQTNALRGKYRYLSVIVGSYCQSHLFIPLPLRRVTPGPSLRNTCFAHPRYQHFSVKLAEKLIYNEKQRFVTDSVIHKNYKHEKNPIKLCSLLKLPSSTRKCRHCARANAPPKNSLFQDPSL